MPEDYLRDDLAKRGLLSIPESEMEDELIRRGFIDTPDGVDYRGNMDQFITEESKSFMINFGREDLQIWTRRLLLF